MGDNFTDSVTSAMVFLLLWTRAYHSYSKTFVLLYKHSLEPGKERIRNIQVLASGIYHLIKSSSVLVANNRKKTKTEEAYSIGQSYQRTMRGTFSIILIKLLLIIKM